MLFQLPIYHKNKVEEVRFFFHYFSVYLFVLSIIIMCALLMFRYVLVSYAFMF